MYTVARTSSPYGGSCCILEDRDRFDIVWIEIIDITMVRKIVDDNKWPH